MAVGYKETKVINGKRYSYYARAYADNIYERKAAREKLGEYAKRERKKGNLARIVLVKGKTHNVYILYVRQGKR